MQDYDSALGLASTLRPASAVTCIRPAAAKAAARFFVERFPGKTFYAVKANPSPELITTLAQAGVMHFDVASITEVRLVRALVPDAVLAFMHPVKAPEAIAEAYHQHGVRAFSLDSEEELAKIMAATNHATDLSLLVRLRVSSGHSKLSLAAKFGIAPDEAAPLLLATRQAADSLGICFHVGSQAMSPQAYADALAIARQAIVKAGVTVDIIDVGGGFPSLYPGMMPPAMERYFDVIRQGFEDLPISYNAELWCEPGRALSAEYASIVVRVEKRAGDVLYINDGVYGSLFDAGQPAWRYPVALLRPSGTKLMDFSFYGPTCDDIDFMQGPFALPADIKAGDYIEIGMLGAYGAAMRTDFNGFRADLTAVVTDAPMFSAYEADMQPSRQRAKGLAAE